MWIKYYLEQIPSPKEWYLMQKTKAGKGCVVLTIIVLLPLLFRQLNHLPRHITFSFWGTLLVYLTTVLLQYLILAWFIKDSKDWTLKIPLIFIIMVFLGLKLTPLVPFEKRGPEQEIDKNTIYVTHVESCPFCQKAKDPLQVAIGLYNLTNKTQVQYVEKTKDTPVAKWLSKKTHSAGSIYYKGNLSIYTQSDQYGHPKRPSLNHLFNMIKRTHHDKTQK